MFIPTIASDLLMDLTTDEQQFIAGGEYRSSGGRNGKVSETENGGNGGGFSSVLCYRITVTPFFQSGEGEGNDEGSERDGDMMQF